MGKLMGLPTEKAFNELFNRFVTSYAERTEDVDFSTWLAARLQEEMPDMSAGESESLSQEIIEAVASYNQTLEGLNKAIELGQSKEEWLSNQFSEVCADMPYEDAGERLQLIDNELYDTNATLIYMVNEDSHNVVHVVDENAGRFENTEPIEHVEHNEYSVKKKIYDIGKQAVMSGIGAATAAIEANTENMQVDEESYSLTDSIATSLQVGIQAASGEVKAVVAGAIKTAAENKLTDLLPADTPTETICDMACVAVEGADALLGAATGKHTMTEALDKTARASVAAVCRWGSNVIKLKLACIPVVGPLVAAVAGGLLNRMKAPKFTASVYEGVRNTVRATWEGIKHTGRSIWNALKNTAKSLISN